MHCLRTLALVSDHAVANVCAQPHSVFHIDVQNLISSICVTISRTGLNKYAYSKSHALIKYCAI